MFQVFVFQVSNKRVTGTKCLYINNKNDMATPSSPDTGAMASRVEVNRQNICIPKPRFTWEYFLCNLPGSRPSLRC